MLIFYPYIIIKTCAFYSFVGVTIGILCFQFPTECFLHQGIEQVVNVLSGLALVLSELFDLLDVGCENMRNLALTGDTPPAAH